MKLNVRFWLGAPFSIRQRRLARSRPRVRKDAFVEQISSSELGQKAARELWEKIMDAVYCSDFTPYPTDNLAKIYGLADEDLDDDIILYLINRFQLEPPDHYIVNEFGPIETPVDVIKLIESLKPRGTTLN